MSGYKGIIFDLDGTLLDSIEDIRDSMNEVLKKFNLSTFNYKKYKMKVGGGFRDLVIKSLPEGTDEETIEKSMVMFSDSYSENYLNKTKPYNGIMNVLTELKKQGIKLGVNSNKRDDYTNDLVDRHFNEIPFIKVYGDREGIIKKPDPTSALEIAKHMDLGVEEILYIGDTKIDILTAKNANMDSAGVLWGFRDREELVNNGAKYIIEDPMNILNLTKQK